MRQRLQIYAAVILLPCASALSQDQSPQLLAHPAAGPRFQVTPSPGANSYTTDIAIGAESPDGTWKSCWSQNLYGYFQSATITDLDQDGFPELILTTQFPGSGAYKEILVLEWDGGGGKGVI